jgi:hypothetical protein
MKSSSKNSNFELHIIYIYIYIYVAQDSYVSKYVMYSAYHT